jgi:GNAT superfamily N-acetyltransferase
MKNAELTMHPLQGESLLPWLEGLGKLRIAVFHEYPYLYEGTLEYELDYLNTYVRSADSLVVIVADSEKKEVGATTCIPLRDEGPEFQAPFLKAGIPVDEVCYFGESILLPQYRGQGLGKEFFARRETHARNLGFVYTAFCAVDRPENHPLKPLGYRPLNDFWLAQGYEKQPRMQATFVWKEIGEEVESPKTLTFWMKSWK